MCIRRLGSGEQRFGFADDVVGGKAVFGKEFVCRCGSAEGVYADDVAAMADDAAPYGANTCFDGEYRQVFRQYGRAVGAVLLVEYFQAGHGHDKGTNY